jgi:hypothetical protein
MYWAELAAVDVVTVMFSSVAVPTGSLAEAPTIHHRPARRPVTDAKRLSPRRGGG